MKESFNQPHSNSHEHPGHSESAIARIEEAREEIAELLLQGVQPFITIPEEHLAELLERGVYVVPKEDLKSGRKFSFIAGTIGLDPYLPESQERYVLEVSPEGVRIEPRLTGTDESFHGVVGFPNGVPSQNFKVIGKYSALTWGAANEEKKAA